MEAATEIRKYWRLWKEGELVKLSLKKVLGWNILKGSNPWLWPGLRAVNQSLPMLTADEKQLMGNILVLFSFFSSIQTITSVIVLKWNVWGACRHSGGHLKNTAPIWRRVFELMLFCHHFLLHQLPLFGSLGLDKNTRWGLMQHSGFGGKCNCLFQRTLLFL